MISLLWFVEEYKKIPIKVFVEEVDCAFHFVPLINPFAKFQTKMTVFISFEKCRISDSFANYFFFRRIMEDGFCVDNFHLVYDRTCVCNVFGSLR